MKKDIEWLREEVLNLYPSHSEMYKYPDGLAVEKVNLLNDFTDLIDQLDEPKKPVVPQFVADYIEKWEHEGLSIGEWFTFNFDDEEEREVGKWLYDNDSEEKRRREYLLIGAILNCYTIEKEPQWVVKIGKGYFSGYDETKVNYVLDDFPGEIAQRIVYDDLNEAESDADDIGGVVEEVTE